jgi:hypothetical protein
LSNTFEAKPLQQQRLGVFVLPQGWVTVATDIGSVTGSVPMSFLKKRWLGRECCFPPGRIAGAVIEIDTHAGRRERV